MNQQETYALISILLMLGCEAAYVRSVLRRQVKPHLFSWLIWGLLDGTAAAGQFAAGAGMGAWCAGVSSLNCLLIMGLSVSYGEKHITFSDKIFLGIALTGLPLWALTKDPLWAVAIATMVDILGYYPTYRKSHARPFEENLGVFALSSLGFGLAILAVEERNVTTLLFPVTIFLVNSLFSLCLVGWRLQKKKKTA